VSATSIEWARYVWNPTTGCDHASRGCDHCYAEVMARRKQAMGDPAYSRDGNAVTSGPGFGFAEHPERLDTPHIWPTPGRVFVNSMSDLFHHEARPAFTDRVWDTMRRVDRHTYLVLTKRPKRMARYAMEKDEPAACVYTGVLPNVWLGTSIEDAEAERRLHWLGLTPAAVRWVSAEPLIGPPSDELPARLAVAGVRWVVIGGESGPNARPMDVGWLRAWAEAADVAGAAVFVKQLGAVWAREHGHRGKGQTKGQDPEKWPAELRRRELPTPREAPVT
jgi:protein gp37